jgi:hypothetical protein
MTDARAPLVFSVVIAAICDEIFTIIDYVKADSLSDSVTKVRSAPIYNNHVLNSMAMWVSTRVIGYNNWGYRLPVFLAGIGSIALLGFILHILFRNPIVTALGISLMSLDGAMINYSHSARGYMIQTFFLLLLILGIVTYEKLESKKRVGLGLITASAVLAYLTLPTSAFYVAAIVITHVILIRNRLSTDKPLIITYAYTAAVCIAWTIYALPLLKSGEGGRAGINAVVTFFAQPFWHVLKTAGALAGALLIVSLSDRKTRLFGAGVLITTVVCAIGAGVTGLGPDRIYAALIPLIYIAAAAAVPAVVAQISESRRTQALMITVLIVLCFHSLRSTRAYQTWVIPDYPAAFQKLEPEVPLTHYINYPSSLGYTIPYNHTAEARVQHAKRAPREDGFILQFASGNGLDCVDVDTGSGMRLEIPADYASHFTFNGRAYTVYKTQQLTETDTPEFLVASIPTVPAEDFAMLRSFLKEYDEGNQHWRLLNLWFKRPVQETADGPTLYTQVYVCKNPGFSISEFVRIEKQMNSKIRFFTLVKQK